jgi:hypothetical protein
MNWLNGMKFIPLFLLSLMAIELHAVASLVADISPTNQIILKSENWQPQSEQTKQALVAIQKYLEVHSTTNNWQAGEIKKILQHSAEYRVQFAGMIHGRKIIWCNFFPANEPRNDWKKEKVEVMDGGFWYWQIEFDPVSGKCLNFSSNGYA